MGTNPLAEGKKQPKDPPGLQLLYLLLPFEKKEKVSNRF